jgi:hypothetical protein
MKEPIDPRSGEELIAGFQAPFSQCDLTGQREQ